MTVPAAVTQFRWDYVMESGIRALTVALALGLPGDYLPPWGPGGINQHGELAVVEQAQRAEQLTADRDRFFFNVREPGRWLMERRASASLWQACPDTVLQRRAAMKVAFLGGPAVPEGQVPLFLSALAKLCCWIVVSSARTANIG